MSSSSYKDHLSLAMLELANHEKTVFLGQGVIDKGTFMSTTLTNVPFEKRIELPVAEEMQMGMSIGLALDGYIPISIYPRFNFIICAMNQLVNHLNVMKPHVIVRVGVGSTKPLDPGPQHTGDWTEAFKMLLPNVVITKLERIEDILPAYRQALEYNGPSMLVEIADFYENTAT